MIPYMVGKNAPNSSHLTKGLVKYVPGRDYFRAVPSQNGDKCVTSPPRVVGAMIVLSPTDAASQEPVMGSAQRVVVARARAPRDAAAQHCLEYLDSKYPDFELEGSTRSVV